MREVASVRRPIYGHGIFPSSIRTDRVENPVVLTSQSPWRQYKKLLPAATEVIFVTSLEEEVLEGHVDRLRKYLSRRPLTGVIGLGGGMVLDAAKFVGWSLQLPVVLVPTALSVDTAFTTATGVRRTKTTPPAIVYLGNCIPEAVLVDFDLLQACPSHLNVAGAMDILSIYTALWDWRESHFRNGERYNAAIADEAAECLLTLLKPEMAEALRRNDESALQVLAECFVQEVAFCEEIDTSRPEEGSEHYLVYALELRCAGFKALHGEVLALAELIVAYLQGQPLSQLLAFFRASNVDFSLSRIGVTPDELCDTLQNMQHFVTEAGFPQGIFHWVSITAEKARLLVAEAQRWTNTESNVPPCPPRFQAKLENARKVLCVQPHYDDNDIAAGGTIARLVAAGCRVVYVTVTDDLRGVLNPAMSDSDARIGLKEEQHFAGKLIGVNEQVWLEYPDAELSTCNYVELRERMLRLIRHHRPDVILTCDPWLPREAHLDHITTGRAVAEAAIFYNLPRLGSGDAGVDGSFFRSLSLGYELQGIAFYYTSEPNILVDITGFHEVKYKAIRNYRLQFTTGELEALVSRLQQTEMEMASRTEPRWVGSRSCQRFEALMWRYVEELHIGPTLPLKEALPLQEVPQKTDIVLPSKQSPRLPTLKKFTDVGKDYMMFKKEMDAEMQEVMKAGALILGPKVEECESRLAAYTGAEHCITVASGTDALVLALQALDIGPGDEVITSAFSWVSSASSIALVGATPVYADVDGGSFLLEAHHCKGLVTSKTKAVLSVSLFGRMPDYRALAEFCGTHGLHLLEDGAQSFGAIDAHGVRSLSAHFVTVATTSFYPTKPLGCFGDGGAVFTNDAKLASAVRQLRNHCLQGGAINPKVQRLGKNSRFDTLQAAVVCVKLRHVDDLIARRVAVADRYSTLLKDLGEKFPFLAWPSCPLGQRQVYAQYTLRLHGKSRRFRDAVFKTMRVPAAIHYSVPLHHQEPLGGRDTGCPVAQSLSEQVLSLPMDPWLTHDEQVDVVAALSDALTIALSQEQGARADVLLLGVGQMGWNHGRVLHELGVLAAVCDQDLERMKRSVNQFHVHAYPTMRAALESDAKTGDNGSIQIGAAVLALPPAVLGESCKAAISAGLDVMVEKPFCLSAQEAAQLTRQAELSNQVLMVGYILRYHAQIKQMLCIVKSGEIGRIMYCKTHRCHPMLRSWSGLGVLHDLAAHDIDFVIRLFGLPSTVSCQCPVMQGQSEFTASNVPCATLSFKWGSAVHADCIVSWVEPTKSHFTLLMGTQGTLRLDGDKLMLLKRSLGEKRGVQGPDEGGLAPTGVQGLDDGGLPPADASVADAEEPLKRELEHFLECRKSRSIPSSGGAEAVDVLRVIECASAALAERRQVFLLPLAPESILWDHGQSSVQQTMLENMLRADGYEGPWVLPQVVAFTQQRYLRKPDEERWHIKGKDTWEVQRPKWMELFANLLMTAPLEAFSSSTRYRAALVMGTDVTDMRKRLEHCLDLIEGGFLRCEEISLVCGERDMGADELEALQKIRSSNVLGHPVEKLGDYQYLPEPRSEPDAAAILGQLCSARKSIPPCKVYAAAKRQGYQRATTHDSLAVWHALQPRLLHSQADNSNSHAVVPYLLVTDQPYGLYQWMVARRTVGPLFDCAAATHSEDHRPVALFLDVLSRCLWEINQLTTSKL